MPMATMATNTMRVPKQMPVARLIIQFAQSGRSCSTDLLLVAARTTVVAVLVVDLGGANCGLIVGEAMPVVGDLYVADWASWKNGRYQSGYLTLETFAFCHSLNSPSASTMLLWKAESSGPYFSTISA